jgi:hypothetical protein
VQPAEKSQQAQQGCCSYGPPHRQKEKEDIGFLQGLQLLNPDQWESVMYLIETLLHVSGLQGPGCGARMNPVDLTVATLSKQSSTLIQ